MIFVAHDLAVVRNISDDVAVMYLGTICETGDVTAIYESPAHPYTRALLDAVPTPDPGAAPAGPALQGEIPSPMSPPSGCRFRTRCPIARDECSTHVPQLREVSPGHRVACHFPLVGEAAVFSTDQAGSQTDQAGSQTEQAGSQADQADAPIDQGDSPADPETAGTAPKDEPDEAAPVVSKD
jgi:peptide/nickel transport system ATP-binding protein